MKILRVAGTNLASLREFDIDFRKLTGGKNEVFAIIGDTGAGKSTILDAICLGLYGKTPRLSKITTIKGNKSGKTISLDDDATFDLNSPLNIMTRGKTSCSATVEFIGRDGRTYRSAFAITKKTKKFYGSLTISLIDNDVAASTSLIDETGTDTRDFTSRIVRYTGLTWDQFQKVIILPQGDFAAFLDADPDAKTDLLQKLTGTEIYKKIDEIVDARTRDVRRSLDQEKAKIAEIGSHLLSDDDIKAKNKELSSRQVELDGIMSKISDVANYDRCFSKIREQEDLVKAAESEEAALTENLNGLKDEKRIIALASLAAPVKELNAAIEEKQKFAESVSAKGKELRETSAVLQNRYEENQKILANRAAAKNQRNKEREDRQTDLDKASEHERNRDKLQTELENLNKNLAAANKALAGIANELDGHNKDRQQIEAAKAKLDAEHENDKPYQDLLPLWSRFNASIPEYRSAAKQLQKQTDEKANLTAKLNGYKASWAECWQKYHKLTNDEGAYSFEEGRIPDAAPMESALQTLEKWHALNAEITSGVSRLKADAGDYLRHAAEFPEKIRNCQSSLAILKEKELSLKKAQESYDAKIPDIEKAEALEREQADIKNRISGLKGQLLTNEAGVTKQEKRINALDARKTELAEQMTALSKRIEDDQKWRSLPSFWNDLRVALEKFRILDAAVRTSEEETAARKQELTAAQKIRDESFQKYQTQVMQDPAYTAPGDAVPLSDIYHEAANALSETQKLAAKLERLLRENETLMADYAGMGDKFGDTCSQVSGDIRALEELRGENSPRIPLENRIRELEDLLRAAEAAEKLKEIAISLKPGDECPCCGSRSHPALDGHNTEISEHLNQLRKNRVKYEEELAEVRQNIKTYDDKETKLSSGLDRYDEELLKAAGEMNDKYQVIAGNSQEIKAILDELEKLAPRSDKPVPGIIAAIENLLHETSEQGQRLPLLTGNAMNELSRLISGYEVKLRDSRAQDEQKEYPEFSEIAAVSPCLADIRSAIAQTAVFREQILEKTASEISDLSNTLRDIPNALDELRRENKQLGDLESAIEQLNEKTEALRTDRENAAKHGSGDQENPVSKVWQELSAASEDDYQKLVRKYDDIAARIARQTSESEKLDTELKNNESSRDEAANELKTLNDLVAADKKAISDAEEKAEAVKEKIKALISDSESAQACRSEFEKTISEAKDASHESQEEFNRGLHSLKQLDGLMTQKYQELTAESAKLSQKAAQTEALIPELPENRLSCISEIRDRLGQAVSAGRELVSIYEGSCLSDLTLAASSCINGLMNLDDGSPDGASAPSDQKIPELLTAASRCQERTSDHEKRLSAAAREITAREKDLKEGIRVLKEAENNRSLYAKDEESLKNIETVIAETKIRQEAMDNDIDNASVIIKELWTELSAASEEKFNSRMTELGNITDRLSRYPDRSANFANQLKGNADSIEACQDRKDAETIKVQGFTADKNAKEKEKDLSSAEVSRLTDGLGVEGLRKRLDKDVKEAEDAHKTAENACLVSERDLKNNQEQIAGNNKELSRISAEISEKQDELSRRIAEIAAASGEFTPEEVLSGLAIMPEEFNGAESKVKDAQARLERAKSNTGKLRAVFTDLEQMLEQYRKGFSPEDFTPEGKISDSFKTQLGKDKANLEQQKLDLDMSLRNDAKYRCDIEACNNRIAEIEAANSALCKLHDMFEKKNGFDKYAQTITFNYLISKSNYYIRQFTDNRYELKQTSSTTKTDKKEANTFHIMVTDHHRGDLNRIVNSLSGGEKFRVALGLALGLSDLISGNIRVDNMFIDEGFDTLDNERLDEVISTLNTVTQRQIGIITHVDQVVHGAMIKSKIRVERSQSDPSMSKVIMDGFSGS